jgi:hypothetical protein
MTRAVAVAVRVLGVALASASLWPLHYALRAVETRDYLAGLLLIGLTWVVARTGVEVAALPSNGSGNGGAP